MVSNTIAAEGVDINRHQGSQDHGVPQELRPSQVQASSEGDNGKDRPARGASVSSGKVGKVGGEVQDPILDFDPSSSSSSSDFKLESWSNSRLPPKLRSDAMSKRISLTNLAKMVEEKKGKKVDESKGTRALREGKGGHAIPEPKKAKSTPNEVMIVAARPVAPREGTSFDKEEVDKLELDRMVSKLFHILGQGVMVGSSLARRGWEMFNEIMLQQDRATSLEGEMTRVKEERDASTNRLAKLELLATKLKEREARAKTGYRGVQIFSPEFWPSQVQASSEGDNGKDRPVRGASISSKKVAMSKRISLTKLAKKVEEKKGKERKGKEAMPIPEPKKAQATPNEVTIVAARPVAPREGTSVNPVAALGPRVNMFRSAATAKKILKTYIPQFDKEEVDKLELDWMVSKLFHILGQAVVVGSSLARQGWEMFNEITLQQDQAASLEVENEDSHYFEKGFDFYKRQLSHYYPNTCIDQDAMDMYRYLIVKEEAEANEKEE
ncbi:hypothetical protein Acr_10g0007220 [Actinidia rufa]|uniref:Uncharacterized protein n=1 Tax=Actinidia rufa TaxID=165716 RepID=A0A7J0FBS2_9ERIC|nr:hypothetical protein Acr_10g0007220 [Actinidia rufa]